MNSRRKCRNYTNQRTKLCCQPVLRAFEDEPFCSCSYHSKKKTTDCRKLWLHIIWYIIWNLFSGAMISALTGKFQASIFLTPVFFALSEGILPAGVGVSVLCSPQGRSMAKAGTPSSCWRPLFPWHLQINVPFQYLWRKKDDWRYWMCKNIHVFASIQLLRGMILHPLAGLWCVGITAHIWRCPRAGMPVCTSSHSFAHQQATSFISWRNGRQLSWGAWRRQ